MVCMGKNASVVEEAPRSDCPNVPAEQLVIHRVDVLCLGPTEA